MKNFTFTNFKKVKSMTLMAFLLFFTLGAMAQTGTPAKSNELQVLAHYYPDATFASSSSVRVFWGMDLDQTHFDFEDGAVPSNWVNDDTYPWIVNTIEIDTVGGLGTYCLRSGNAGVASSTSSLQASVYFQQSGTISFVAGCYGEGENYDVCEFYIDGEQQFEYGEINTWETYSFNVSPGLHTFKWSYTKDSSVNSSFDGFYLDNVFFTNIGGAKAETNVYNVYRALFDAATGGEIGERDTIAAYITNKQLIDTTWKNLPVGEYRYAVEILSNTPTPAQELYWSNILSKPEVQYYDITVSADPVQAGTVTGGRTYAEGETCTLKAIPNYGYYVSYWTYNGEEIESYNSQYTFTVTEDAEIVAHFTPESFGYEVQAEPEDGGEARIVFEDEQEGEVRFGDTITLRAIPNLGYSFVKWTAYGGTMVKGGRNRSGEYFISDSALCQQVIDQEFLEIIFATDTIDDPEDDPESDGVFIVFVATFEEGIDGCMRPQQFSYTDVGPDFVSLNWTEKGEAESWYIFYHEAVSTTVPVDTSVLVTQNPCTLWQLHPNTPYEMYVISACGVDNGVPNGILFSDTIRFTTLGPCPTPLHVEVDSVTGSTAHVKWMDYSNSYLVQTGIPNFIVNENFDNGEIPSDWDNSSDHPWVIDSISSPTGFCMISSNGGFGSSSSSISITKTFNGAGIVEFDAECRGEGGFTGSVWDQCTFSTEDTTYFTYGATVEGWNHYHFDVEAGEHTFTWSYTKDGSVDPEGDYFAIDNVVMREAEVDWSNPLPVEEAQCTVTGLIPLTTYAVQVKGICDEGQTDWCDPVYFTTTNECVITATANPTDAGTITGGGTYIIGDTCTLTATPNVGYTFTNWTMNDSIVSTLRIYSFTVTEPATYVANFQVSSYEITISADPTDGGIVTGSNATSNMYNYGTTCTLTATPNEGYSFVNWTEESDVVATTAVYSFTVGVARSLVAHFSLNSYTVTATANPTTGGTITGDGTYEYGSECTLTASPATGYYFVNWTRNGEVVDDFESINFYVLDSVEYVANFAKKEYYPWFTYIPEDGGFANITSHDTDSTVYYGDQVTIEATPEDGYEFVKWATSNMTPEGNDTIVDLSTNNPFTFLMDQEFLSNFIDNGDGVEIEFIAYFKQGAHVVSANANPAVGGEVSGTGSFEHGESCTLTATPATGYYFVNWTLNGQEVSTSATYTFDVTATATYVANFAKKEYYPWFTIIPVNGGDAIITSHAADSTVYYGDQVIIEAIPATGYEFVNWTTYNTDSTTVVLSTDAQFTFEMNETILNNFLDNGEGGEIEFVANFKLGAHDVSANANPAVGGEVSGTGTFEHGSSCTLTATPATGYYFVNWTLNGDEVSSSATYTFDVMAAATYVANFAKKEYYPWFTIIPENGGDAIITSHAADSTVYYGDQVTIEATPATGYGFVNWTTYNTDTTTVVLSTEALFTFEMNETFLSNFIDNGEGGEIEFIANFQLGSYAISASVNPANTGSVSGTGSYDHFANCTLTAEPAEGYHFVNWTLNGSEVSTSASYQFQVTGAAAYVANFAINNYEITASVNPANTGSVTGTGSYDHFANCTLTAEPAEGYHFVNWTLNGSEVSTSASYQFQVTGAAAYVANFAINNYEITASVNPANTGSVTGTGSYDHFANCTLTAEPAEGYHFVNWTLNGSEVSTSASYQFQVTGAAAYVANFAINNYEITASVNPANTGSVSGTGTYEHFSTCTLTATPATGYHFLNWTLNGQEVGTSETLSFEVTGAANYVANFEINSYNITAMISVNPTNGGTVEGAGVFNFGQTCNLTAIPATGHHFLNWTWNGQVVSSSVTYSFIVTEEGVLVANFEINSYDITAMVSVNPINGGTVEGAGVFTYGQTCTLTAIPAEGHHFVNWTVNGQEVSTSASYQFQVTGEAAYVANFAINNYEITASVNPANTGSITGTGSYDHFANCTLTAEPAEGYHFVNWTLNGSEVSTSASYQFQVTGAAAYVANFEINSYEITASVNPANMGSVSGTGTYEHFSTCTLTATPATGYHFLNWTLEGVEVGTSETLSFEVTGAANYVANFEINSYNITAMISVNPINGGTVEGAGVFTFGQTCTLTAIPATGHHFLNWTWNGQVVSTSLTYSFVVTEEGVLVANFEINSYNITAMVSVNPTNGGTITGTGVFTYGQTCTLTAIPAEGYHFVNWTVNGEQVTTSTNYSFTVTDETVIVANFAINNYNVTAMASPVGSGSVSGAGMYSHFSTCTLTATPASGYHFVNWTRNGQVVGTTPTYSFQVTSAASFVAHFDHNDVTITAYAVPTNAGSITGAGAYAYGETCTLTATPATGYYFEKWTLGTETVSTEAVYSFEATENATYKAHFISIDYTISAEANPEEGGTITGTGELFHYNTTCQLVAHVNTGYHFVNWTLNGVVVSTEHIYSFSVTESAHYVANFELDTFVITAIADPEEGGTVTGGGTYAYGQTVTLTATAGTDFRFENWTEGDEVVSEEATITFTVDSDRQLVAHFINTVGVNEQNELMVNLYPNPASDKLFVEVDRPASRCEIYTITGSRVFVQDNFGEKFEIEVSDLPSGTYVIRVVSDSMVKTLRFVKQ